MHVQVALCLLFEDLGHRLATTLVSVGSWHVLLLVSGGANHATLGLTWHVEAMDLLLEASIVVIGRARYGSLRDDHFVGKGDPLGMGEGPAVFDRLACLLPVSLVGVLAWVDAALRMPDHLIHVARGGTLHSEFSEGKSMLDTVLVISSGKRVSRSQQFIELDGASRAL